MEHKEFDIVNEIVMNEYTMNEIWLGIWKKRTGRNKIPVLLYLAAVLIPLVYGMTTGKGGYTLLAAGLFWAGLAGLFAYLGISAYRNTKKGRQLIRKMLERYGKEALLRVCIGENIVYSFDGITKTVSCREIEKLIRLDMYLILKLKNGVCLPVWKAGFQKGRWEDAVTVIRVCSKSRALKAESQAE